MPKKACCCKGPPPPESDVCLIIDNSCLGKTYRFTADFKLRFMCRPFGGGVDARRTYTCANGEIYTISDVLEHWRLTWTHTINLTQPAAELYDLYDTGPFDTNFADSSEYTLQYIGSNSTDPDYTTKLNPQLIQLAYRCDAFIGFQYYRVGLVMGVGYRDELPCGELFEIPYSQDPLGLFWPCGNELYFAWQRSINTTVEECIATTRLSGSIYDSTFCVDKYRTQWLAECTSETVILDAEEYTRADGYLSGNDLTCGDGCDITDQTIFPNQNYFFCSREMIVESI